MQCAIRHPEKVRKVVSISAAFRRDGWVKEALDMFIEIGHLAQHDTRHADGAHARHRSDGERLFRCKTAKAIKKLYNL